MILPVGGSGAIELWKGNRLNQFRRPVAILEDLDTDPHTEVTYSDIQDKLLKCDTFVIKHSVREMENLLSFSLIVDTLADGWNINRDSLAEALAQECLQTGDLSTVDIPESCASAFFRLRNPGETVDRKGDAFRKKESAVKKMLAHAYH